MKAKTPMWICPEVGISPKKTLRSARRAVAVVRQDTQPKLANFVNKRNGRRVTAFTLPPGYTTALREKAEGKAEEAA
jgi:hypothetical protein